MNQQRVALVNILSDVLAVCHCP